mmetsp:Transcript_19044/g.41401  ORF Transcript_19044/g.41401 Transcript_19044/m.41401 type:complete len:324 (+) Transcript_19044:70-1041(+)
MYIDASPHKDTYFAFVTMQCVAPQKPSCDSCELRSGRCLCEFLLFFVHSLFASRFVIFDKPINRLLNSIGHGSEFVVGTVLSKLLVAGRLLVLTIGLAGIKIDLPLELHGLCYGKGNVLNGNFVGLVDTKNDGIGFVVLPCDPHSELGEVSAVNELSERSPTAPNAKRCVVSLGFVTLVDQTRNYVPLVDREVIVSTVNIRGDYGSEVASVFVSVGAIHGVDHALGICVSLVGVMGRSVVNHSLIDGEGRLVWEDARAQHADELFDFVDPAAFHDVVVHDDVFAIKLHLLGHVGKEAANLGGQVNNMGRLVLFENRLGRFSVD